MGFHPFCPFGANLGFAAIHRAQKLCGDLAVRQPYRFLVALEVVPSRLVNAEPHEPSEQKIELYPFHQLTLTANAVEGLKQHRAQQALRRYREAAKPRWIKLRKIDIHIRKSCVDDLPNRPRADLWVSTEPVTVLPSASY